jgi:hypothetical protein
MHFSLATQQCGTKYLFNCTETTVVSSNDNSRLGLQLGAMSTAVIVPSSFAAPSMYESLSQSLTRNDIPNEIVDLPSVGRREVKPATMIDDVNEIVSVVERLVDQGREVVL